MYKNYFKIGYRSLLRNKGYSSINIGGLAVGLTVAILIGLWVNDELSFDKVHNNYDRVARVMQHKTFSGNTNTGLAIPVLLEQELRAEHGSDFKYLATAFWKREQILSFGNKKFNKRGNYMGSDIINIFSLKMLSGSSDALTDPSSIILSQSTAKTLFGELDPMGQQMKINNDLDVMVTGVYEDFPKNSTLHNLEFIAPWELFVSANDWVRNLGDHAWYSNSFQLFVQLEDYVALTDLNGKIEKIVYDHGDDIVHNWDPKVFLHPMRDWHLKSNWKNGHQEGGLIDFVWLFALIGVFVLMLACINFMNLTTAHSEKRSKEVGIRKSIGSLRSQLINQFLTESFLVVSLSFVLALLAVFFLLPYFNIISDKQIALPFNNLSFWWISMAFIFVTSLLSGSYPALYLSSFRPVDVLKGTFRVGGSTTLLRKILVVSQFTVSITLIIGTLIVTKQVNHAKNRPLGYDNNGIISIQKNSPDFDGKYEVLRTSLKDKRAIVEMAESTSPLTAFFSNTAAIRWKDKDPGFLARFATNGVTHDFGNMLGWNIVEGRDFSRKFATDSSALIVNQAAIDYMGMQNPIGKEIMWGDGDRADRYKIIGVVEDMLVESPFGVVRPTLYYNNYDNTGFIELRLHPEKDMRKSIAIIENVFKEVLPGIPFDFEFVDQTHARKFKDQERIGSLSAIFAGLAIFISCLGLFGMASYVAERKTKEIGIRKVLGASVTNLWKMMSKEFVILVLIACIIAVPFAYYVLENWLNDIQYRTTINWWVFAIAIASAVLITLITVSYHAISSARRNPANSLRAE